MNLQPLQSNLKVLQEQQTQDKHSTVWRYSLTNSQRSGWLGLRENLGRLFTPFHACRKVLAAQLPPTAQHQHPIVAWDERGV